VQRLRRRQLQAESHSRSKNTTSARWMTHLTRRWPHPEQIVANGDGGYFSGRAWTAPLFEAGFRNGQNDAIEVVLGSCSAQMKKPTLNHDADELPQMHTPSLNNNPFLPMHSSVSSFISRLSA